MGCSRRRLRFTHLPLTSIASTAITQEAIMIYEYRYYHCVTGLLPALLKRFETTTLELWKRHGIRQAGFWTVLVGNGGNQDLHYLLAWDSMAERETKWNKFASDPEWLENRAASERDGPIVASIYNMFLQPTAVSAVKRPAGRRRPKLL